MNAGWREGEVTLLFGLKKKEIVTDYDVKVEWKFV